MSKNIFFVLTICLALVAIAYGAKQTVADDNDNALTLVCMDPLAAPLACDCVKGYAQRKYEKLGEFLQKKLNRPVKVVWGESIGKATAEIDSSGDIIIGKHSVVLSDAKNLKMKVKPIAQLTDQTGSVEQTGLIVVRAKDKAKTVADLKGYRIFFGPEDCDEKSAAPMELIKSAGVKLPEDIEISGACSEAATKLVELDKNIDAAAVISSYAEKLLEGCGTVQKGDLRVIGRSKPVPFITAFANAELSEKEIKQITNALLEVQGDPELLIAIESLSGFTNDQLGGTTNTSKSSETKKK